MARAKMYAVQGRLLFTSAAELVIWRDLPYGLWTCASGREVLFNRGYNPMWHREPGQPAEPVHWDTWVDFVRSGWFYVDRSPPRQTSPDRRRFTAGLSSVLEAFKAGQPIPADAFVTPEREAHPMWGPSHPGDLAPLTSPPGPGSCHLPAGRPTPPLAHRRAGVGPSSRAG
jgi:hypothetical protein